MKSVYFTFLPPGVFPCAQWRQLHPLAASGSRSPRISRTNSHSFMERPGYQQPNGRMSPLHRDPAARYKAYCHRLGSRSRSSQPAEGGERSSPEWAVRAVAEVTERRAEIGWSTVVVQIHHWADGIRQPQATDPALSHCRLTVRVVHRREDPGRNAGLASLEADRAVHQSWMEISRGGEEASVRGSW